MQGIELLQAWMAKAGVDKKALDNSGRVLAFVYGDELPVTVESPAYCDDLFIIIELCPVGAGDIRRKRLEKAMQLNAYALETRGAAIGWDNIGERIILTHRTAAENTDINMLDNMIANLIDVAETIKPQLAMDKEVKTQEQLANTIDQMFQPIVP